jgi:hypothetical protein
MEKGLGFRKSWVMGGSMMDLGMGEGFPGFGRFWVWESVGHLGMEREFKVQVGEPGLKGE